MYNENYNFDLKIEISKKVLEELSSFFTPTQGAYPYPVRALFGGKRKFSVYFSNSSNEKFGNSINILLATDVENKENNVVLEELGNSTLSIYGRDTADKFIITKILRVPRLVGTKNGRVISADVSFSPNHFGNYSEKYRTFIDEVFSLPNTQIETQKVTERITHWDEYLKINQKIAQESQTTVNFNGIEKSNNVMEINFYITEGVILSKHVNSTVQLVLNEVLVEENQIDYRGPQIGTITRFNKYTNMLTVALDYDFYEALLEKRSSLPKEGKLFVSKFGELVQILRMRNGLISFSRGQALNPRLDSFIFDASKVKPFIGVPEIINREDLLQTNLNDAQKKAVEGALNSTDLYLIQGPPGTGKTTVISEICYQNAIRNKKTLIASQTNLAVDNALSKLAYHPKIRALRKGNEHNIQEEGLLFTENNVIQTWLQKTSNGCKKNIAEKQDRIKYSLEVEKQLPTIVQCYKEYVSAKETESKLATELSIKSDIKAELSEKLLKAKEIFDEFEKPISANTLQNVIAFFNCVDDNILNSSTTLLEEFEQNQKEIKDCSERCAFLDNNFKTIESSIDKIDLIFQKANKKGRYIVAEANLEIKDFAVWKDILNNLKTEINTAWAKKPIFFAFWFGMAKNWLLLVSSLLGEYNEFKSATSVLDNELEEKLNVLLEAKELHKSFKELSEKIASYVDSLNFALNVVAEEIHQIESEKEKFTYKKETNFEIIQSFNKKLPYDINFPKSIDDVVKSFEFENIANFYISLWDKEKKTDVKQIKFVAEWVKRIDEQNEEDYASLKQLYIDNANVIGITCNQSGSKEFTENYPEFDVCIIDEVSKATPPELILPILKAKKIILVGDHKQLPPMIGMETYDEVAKQLEISEEETEHMKVSLFEELFEKASDDIKIMLSTQYRMHNQIMDNINQFYQDENDVGLNCGIVNPDIARAHSCHGKGITTDNHAMWVDIPLSSENSEEQTHYNYSYLNRSEVTCIKNILLTISGNLAANGFSGKKKIGVISFYSSQVRLLEDELLNKDFAERIDNLMLRIGSVDRFQGIECPIVICSFVRNNSRGDIGFAKDPRRINVALSRAQELSIIVGCSELFCNGNNYKSSAPYRTIANNILETGGARNAGDFE